MRPATRVIIAAAVWAASACGGDASTPPIVAPAAVATVEILPAVQTVPAGQSISLTAIVRDAKGATLPGRPVTWTSDLPAVAFVSTSGVVSALASGTVTITATSEGKSGTVAVIVPPVIATLVIDSIQSKLWVGRSVQLLFQVRYQGGQPALAQSPQWVSSAPAIVSVSNIGMLTGVSAGSATITGTLDDGQATSRTIVAVPIPPAVVSLQPETATLPRGVDYALAARVADIDGKLLTGYTVTFQSSDPSIATVSAQGVVRPVANGSVAIVATANGTEQATSRITVADPRLVSGQVITADGGRPRNLQFVARFGLTASAQRFVAAIDSLSGAFSLVMPVFGANGPTIEYFVDVASGTARPYHVSYRAMPGATVTVPPRILLIPHSVTPDSGTYAGRAFAVDLNEAFTPVCTTTSDANCQSYWPSYWVSSIKFWADTSRPVPVAFDRTPGTIAAADSVAIWTTLRGMEADLGRALFRPAAFTVHSSPGYTTGMVLVSRDATVAPFAGYTNWSWDGQGNLYQGKVRLANAQVFASNSTVTHEFTHALGFSHTCRWSTVMGGYGCGQQGRLSPNDVAYYHLAEMVRRQIRALAPTWGISESLQGARVIEQGMSVANAVPLPLRALLSRHEQPGSDGAP